MNKEWDEVTGINPPFSRTRPLGPHAHPDGNLCDACLARAAEHRHSGCICDSCQAYWGAVKRHRFDVRSKAARQELELKSEQARVDQIRARYGRGRER